MQDRMTAAEYRAYIAKGKDDGAMSDEEFQKTLKNQQLDYANKINKKPRNDEEDQITIQVAEYCELLMVQKKIRCYSHIPQETFTKSWATKNKNKAMGVRAGVPDMLIVYPNKVLFLELKRLKGGKVSEAQQAWIEALTCVSGNVYAAIAAGFDAAKREIDDLLE